MKFPKKLQCVIFDMDGVIIDSEEIFAAIPSNQLLRPWDNVPKKAVAQEVTGNRIVYGNYTQNFDLINDSGMTSYSLDPTPISQPYPDTSG